MIYRWSVTCQVISLANPSNRGRDCLIAGTEKSANPSRRIVRPHLFPIVESKRFGCLVCSIYRSRPNNSMLGTIETQKAKFTVHSVDTNSLITAINDQNESPRLEHNNRLDMQTDLENGLVFQQLQPNHPIFHPIRPTRHRQLGFS